MKWWVLLAVLLLTGCRSAPSLIGQWEILGNRERARITFLEDGRFRNEIVIVERPTPVVLEVSGRYRLVGEKLEVAGETVEVRGSASPDFQLMVQAFADRFRQTVIGKMSWQGKNEFTLDAPGRVLTFRRMKAASP